MSDGRCEEIRQDVLNQIANHPELHDENISIELEGEELTLCGDVQSDDNNSKTGATSRDQEAFTKVGTMLSHNWRFKDRIHAGRKLGERLLVRAFPEAIILALPRGGVPVAEEVARLLGAPLDVVIARKIGAPGQKEFGIGAISEDEVPHFNSNMLNYFDATGAEIKATVKTETEELRRRIANYRGGRELPDLEGKTVILIDDGLATGVTAAAAGAFLRTRHPKELIFAAPVCPQDIRSEVREPFDEIICLQSPKNFQAVGLWYEEFHQVEDDEVMFILNRHHLNAKIPRNDMKPNLDRTT